MNDLAADLLSRVQGAPGRWTIDQLSSAAGVPPVRVVLTVAVLIREGHIEPARVSAEVADLDSAPTVERRHTFCPRPTGKAWIVPAARPRT